MKTFSWLLLLVMVVTVKAEPLRIESLGAPVQGSISLPVIGLTRSANGRIWAWAPVRHPDRRGVLGVDPDTGKTIWLDLSEYQPRVLLARTSGDKLFAMVGPGKDGIVVEFHPDDGTRKVHHLPLKNHYFLNVSADISPEGVFYAGTYPEVEIGWLDPATGVTGASGRISPDPAQKYVIDLFVGRDGYIYFSAGEKHPEVWSYHPGSKRSRQLVPEEMRRKNGRVRLWRDAEGNIHFVLNGQYFRCSDGTANVVAGTDVPSVRYDHDHLPPEVLTLPDGRRALRIDPEGRLVLGNPDGSETTVATDFSPLHPLVYSISPGLNGRIWVGSFSPAALAAFEHGDARPVFRQYGKPSRGGVQIYCCRELPGGRVLLSSYVNAYLDLLDVNTGQSKPIACLGKSASQDRVFQLLQGRDGRIFGPAMPLKGLLGGGIVEWNPETEAWHFTRNVIPDQSIRALAETADGCLFGVSDINGGTSAIAKAKNACIFLWDPASRKVVWQFEPRKREQYYLGAFHLDENRIWTLGRTSRTVFLVDVNRRRVVKEVLIREKGSMKPIGSFNGRAYVFVGDALMEIDFENGRAVPILRSPVIARKFSGSLHDTQAECLTADGTIYFGAGAELYRIRLR